MKKISLIIGSSVIDLYFSSPEALTLLLHRYLHNVSEFTLIDGNKHYSYVVDDFIIYASQCVYNPLILPIIEKGLR